MHGQILTLPTTMNYQTTTGTSKVNFPTPCGALGSATTAQTGSLEWAANHTTWVGVYACLLTIHPALSVLRSSRQWIYAQVLMKSCLDTQKRTILASTLSHHCSQPGSHQQSHWVVDSPMVSPIRSHQVARPQPRLLSRSHSPRYLVVCEVADFPAIHFLIWRHLPIATTAEG